MTFILKKLEVPQKDEIVHLIENNLNVLDGSLQLIAKNLGPRNESPWELVGVRQDRRLILIAVETRVFDRMLLKLLRNLDWAWENVETFASIYASYGIDSNQMPCVMVVAPSYPLFFKKSVNYLTYRIEVKLFTYSCLESEKGRGLFVETVDKKVVKYEPSVKTDTGIRIPREGISKNVKITTDEIMEFLQ
jgi:hypothetical protein